MCPKATVGENTQLLAENFVKSVDYLRVLWFWLYKIQKKRYNNYIIASLQERSAKSQCDVGSGRAVLRCVIIVYGTFNLYRESVF